MINHSLLTQLQITPLFHDAPNKCSEERLKELERRIDLQIPDSYKEFLRIYGASVFEEEVVFPCSEPSIWYRNGKGSFTLLYGFLDDDAYDVLLVLVESKRDLPDFPSNMLPIGEDPAQNLLLLLLPKGQIYFYERESGKTHFITVR